MKYLKDWELFESKIDYEKLKQDNRLRFPKIPVENVFLNSRGDMYKVAPHNHELWTYYEDADKSDKYKTLPLELINIKDIFPTQKFLTVKNIKSTESIGINTSAFMTSINGKYYILDGHHRIASNILKGEREIYAYVYKQK